ncbi:hypothetical protein PLIP_a2910 [Pseudoalteromonas lipolytica LMEB 39]|nr:hypothetical protein [Pseudoalteromonas lipolytica LMEB 39]
MGMAIKKAKNRVSLIGTITTEVTSVAIMLVLLGKFDTKGADIKS